MLSARTAKVVRTIGKTRRVLQGVKELTESRLFVGIPQTKAPRTGPINNAALGYIHEFGSAAARIPARPWLKPGVQSIRKELALRFAKAGQGVLGGREKIEKHLMAIGLLAVNAVRKRIQAGIPPPLAPSTVARRRQRSAGSKYRRKATTAAQTTPLIDTGKMLASITYVIRKVKK